MKAPAPSVKPLEGPEEAFDGIGRRGQAGAALAAEEPGQLLLHPGNPWSDPQRRGLFPQPCESPPEGVLIVALKHLLHDRLAGVDLFCFCDPLSSVATTVQHAGGGWGSHTRKVLDKHDKVHAIAVMVYTAR
jgi:hypothetical protein